MKRLSKIVTTAVIAAALYFTPATADYVQPRTEIETDEYAEVYDIKQDTVMVQDYKVPLEAMETLETIIGIQEGEVRVIDYEIGFDYKMYKELEGTPYPETVEDNLPALLKRIDFNQDKKIETQAAELYLNYIIMQKYEL